MDGPGGEWENPTVLKVQLHGKRESEEMALLIYLVHTCGVPFSGNHPINKGLDQQQVVIPHRLTIYTCNMLSA